MVINIPPPMDVWETISAATGCGNLNHTETESSPYYSPRNNSMSSNTNNNRASISNPFFKRFQFGAKQTNPPPARSSAGMPSGLRSGLPSGIWDTRWYNTHKQEHNSRARRTQPLPFSLFGGSFRYVILRLVFTVRIVVINKIITIQCKKETTNRLVETRSLCIFQAFFNDFFCERVSLVLLF